MDLIRLRWPAILRSSPGVPEEMSHPPENWDKSKVEVAAAVAMELWVGFAFGLGAGLAAMLPVWNLSAGVSSAAGLALALLHLHSPAAGATGLAIAAAVWVLPAIGHPVGRLAAEAAVSAVGGWAVGLGLHLARLEPIIWFPIGAATLLAAMVTVRWAGMQLDGCALRGLPAGAGETVTETDQPFPWPSLLAGWWSVPLNLGLAGMLHLTVAHPLARAAALLGLALVQWLLHQINNQRFQDRAVGEMVRRFGVGRHRDPAVYEQMLRLGHQISGLLGLEPEAARWVLYACMLQDAGGEPPPAAAYVGSAPPQGDLRRAVIGHVKRALAVLERVPVLRPAVPAVCHCFAWYDGTGVPGLAGDRLAPAARVLAAVNGLAVLAGQGADAQAEWLQRESGRRLDPRVAAAALAAVRQEQKPGPDLLPEALRRLQMLSARNGWLPAWLVRLWQLLQPGQRGLAQEIVAVTQLCQAVGTHTDPDGAMAAVVEAAAELAGGPAALALVQPDTGRYVLRAAHGFRRMQMVGEVLTLLAGPLTRALIEGMPYQYADIAVDSQGPLAARLEREEGIRTMLVLPLMARGQTIGALLVGRHRVQPFSDRLASLLSVVAGQAALALENARLLAQAEERLNRVSALNRFTQFLIENLHAGLVVLDLQRRITIINRMGREIMSRAGAGDLQPGDPFPVMIDSPDAPSVKVLATGQASEGYIWNVDHGLVVEVSAAPLHNEQGELSGAMVLGRDVTRTVQMEQQVQRVERLAAVGQLAAGAAHEIRNPLAAIRGFIQLMNAYQDPGSDGAEYAQIALEEIDRLDNIVRNLLLLGRPAPPSRSAVRLAGLLEDALRLSSADTERVGIEVARHYAREAPPANGDSHLLKQVAHNLIRNALDAMPDGGTLILSTGRSGDRAWFRVADTGPGMDQDSLERLFLPFYTTKATGTGLGLPICHSLVRLHGGEIKVRSQPGEGAEFTVFLPIADGAGSTTAEQESAAQQHQAKADPERAPAHGEG